MTTVPFVPFPKIPRLNRACVITEKIDGTNASVLITEDGDMFAGSRSRWVMPGKDDNYGFAAFVFGNRDMFAGLGPGHHFGEWWGQGIQRRYGMTEKRFSLFNTGRWIDGPVPLPEGLYTVPVLFEGQFSTGIVDSTVARLSEHGSQAAPGFMKPEGVIVYLVAAKTLHKVTCVDDEKAKGEAA